MAKRILHYFSMILAGTAVLSADVHAFFSPGTLTMLSASIASGIKQLIILGLSFIIALFLNIKMKLKKRYIMIAGTIILFFAIAFLAGRFFSISELNDEGLKSYNQALASLKGIDDTQGLFSAGLLDDPAYSECAERESFQKQKECVISKRLKAEISEYSRSGGYVDLDEVLPDEFDSYRKYAVEFHPKLMLSGAEPLKNPIDLILDPSRLRDILGDRKGKILFYCHGGSSAKILGYLASRMGYDAHYTSLRDVKTGSYINSSVISETAERLYTMTLPFSMKRGDKNLYLNFEEDPSVIAEIKERFKPIVVYDYFPLGYYNQIDEFREEAGKRDILCNNELNCLLAKHALFSMNISKKAVYMIGT